MSLFETASLSYTAAAASTEPEYLIPNLEEGVSNIGPIPANKRKILQAEKPTDILKSLSFLKASSTWQHNSWKKLRRKRVSIQGLRLQGYFHSLSNQHLLSDIVEVRQMVLGYRTSGTLQAS